MKIKIAIVEDVPELAKALEQKFSIFDEVDVIFMASNGLELLEKLKDNPVEVVLMDINMPIMDGIRATEKVKKQFPEVKVLMHTVYDEDDKIFQSILSGASGYVLKDDKPKRIILSIEEAVEGGAPMSSVIASKVLSMIKSNTESKVKDFGLTKRELQILQRVGKGENYQEIADVLFISPKTVRNHIEKVYKKLQVHNRVDAIKVAIKNNLISNS